MPEAAIEFVQVHKRYGGKTVVDGLSFHVQPGECFGLLGPNGAGKTTTLRMLLGIAAPDAGTIRLGGEPIPSRARYARARVGVVPQFDNLDPDFTVRENLLVFGRYFGLSAAQTRAMVPSLLEFARLESKADARVGELSGGMKRRLTLARALVNDPDVLIMDEPTTGLDPQARHLIWERLRSLLARGKTILLTTHFMEEAERLCHRLTDRFGNWLRCDRDLRTGPCRVARRTGAACRAYGDQRRDAVLLCHRRGAGTCPPQAARGSALSAPASQSRRCVSAAHRP
jgi:lipooligosaccharide transport system ATP-binding protein